ncbi:hypothetical protein HMPREF9412_5025 [Paenibacillus sp. HGF5]|nr:hypothetical protein HMPREF9412_5025 [Paenibacillus sp. HGF5]
MGENVSTFKVDTEAGGRIEGYAEGVLNKKDYPTVKHIYGWLGEFRELWSAAVKSEGKNCALKKLVSEL